MSANTLTPDSTERRQSVFVVGDDPVAHELAKRLDDRHDVTHATNEDPPPSTPVTTVTADPTVGNELAEAGVGGADVALVATGRDETNLLAGRLAALQGADRVVAFVYDSSTEDCIREADIETVSVACAIEGAVSERFDG